MRRPSAVNSGTSPGSSFAGRSSAVSDMGVAPCCGAEVPRLSSARRAAASTETGELRVRVHPDRVMPRGAGAGDRVAVPEASPAKEAPERAGLVLAALILVAGVANLNLSVANVALPDIGRHFDSSQTTLDLIAVGYSLGLAASVLYLGALGDRYGRKLMLLL